MTDILASSVLAVLGFGGFIAIRYVRAQSKTALLVAALILTETVLIAVVLVFLSTEVIFDQPWLDVVWQPLAEQALGITTTIAVLGISSVFIMRYIGHDCSLRAAPLLSILLLLTAVVLIAGLWVAHNTPKLAAPISVSTPTPIATVLPTHTPTPSSTPVVPTALTRHPYLGECTTDSVVIAWRTPRNTTSTVTYGSTPAMHLVLGDSTPTTSHAVKVDELEPNTRYYYRAFSEGLPLTSVKSFRTAKTPEQESFSFAVFGDSGIGSPAQFGIASIVDAMDPEFILHTGDVIQTDGRPEHWDPFYFVPYRNMLDSICIFTTIGNHDAATPGEYEEALYLPHNNPEGSELYYSFAWGNTHFVSLNSLVRTSAGTDLANMLDWLRADLEQASQDPNILWKIVFTHNPPFSSHTPAPREAIGAGVPPESNRVIRNLFQGLFSPIFEQFGVDIVFAGHDHTYERTCPILAVFQLKTGGNALLLTRTVFFT